MKGLASLVNKWVLITGAASGIGFSTARAFARHGANLILTDVNDALLKAAERNLAGSGGECLTIICDVSNANSVTECAEALRQQGIVPDVLINNAGIAYIGGFLETPVEQWQRIFNVNVFGLVHVTRAFLPAMKASGVPKRIVNIASTAAYLPAPNMSAYAASKGAVKQFNEVLAMELSGSNVSLQCIYPGIINTPIIGGIKSMGANISEAQLATLQRYYIDHGCSPDVVGNDIAAAVLTGKSHVFTGPMSWLGNLVTRLSPALARKVTLLASRTNGYMPRDTVPPAPTFTK